MWNFLSFILYELTGNILTLLSTLPLFSGAKFIDKEFAAIWEVCHGGNRPCSLLMVS